MPKLAMTLTSLACYRCGYDLRAHPDNGICPECGLTVDETRRQTALHLRPAWRDSDPRWRRRILAGLWILVLIPLMSLLKATGLAAVVPVIGLFILHNDIRTLDDTFLAKFRLFESLMFCIGAGLLFAIERNRRMARFDWTRRWGLRCSYVTLLLIAAGPLFIAALVGVGIASSFLSMPLKYTPPGTMVLVNVCGTYLRFGPQEGYFAALFRVIFSSAVVLFACVPLFDALRRTGIKRMAFIAVAPLASFSVVQCVQEVVGYWRAWGTGLDDGALYLYSVYFCPWILFQNDPSLYSISQEILFPVELIKWADVLAVAIWLTIAQFIKRRPSQIPQI